MSRCVLFYTCNNNIYNEVYRLLTARGIYADFGSNFFTFCSVNIGNFVGDVIIIIIIILSIISV